MFTGTFGSKYSLGEKIGSGAFAKVYKCLCRETGDIRIVKIISNSTKNNNGLNEALIMKSLRHKYIPRIYDLYDNDDNIYIVMEYFTLMTLFQYISKYAPLNGNIAQAITRKILEVLDYLHSLNIAHLDIKPENIIIDPVSLNIKLIDFGFATKNASNCEDFNGSISYAAPEIFFNKAFDARKADVWSTSVIYFAMIKGCLPFTPSKNGRDKQIKDIISGKNITLPQETDELTRKLIQMMLVVKPDERATTRMVLAEMDSKRIPKCFRATSQLTSTKRFKIVYPSVRNKSNIV